MERENEFKVKFGYLIIRQFLFTFRLEGFELEKLDCIELTHFEFLIIPHKSMAQIKNNNTKKKFHKKKFNNGKAPKKKVKQHVLEDNEIKEIQESYEKIVNHQEIKTFDDIPLSKKTRKGLLQCKFKFPTDIQKQSLGPALKGKDILGASHTGSGKTLAFLIPILENLYLKKWSRIDGVGAVSLIKH